MEPANEANEANKANNLQSGERDSEQGAEQRTNILST